MIYLFPGIVVRNIIDNNVPGSEHNNDKKKLNFAFLNCINLVEKKKIICDEKPCTTSNTIKSERRFVILEKKFLPIKATIKNTINDIIEIVRMLDK
jgi:hypothetical protein